MLSTPRQRVDLILDLDNCFFRSRIQRNPQLPYLFIDLSSCEPAEVEPADPRS